MKSLLLIGICSSCLFILKANAQYYEGQESQWLTEAEANKPVLHQTIIQPTQLVRLVQDKAAFQGWKAIAYAGLDSLYIQGFKDRGPIVLDFGNHYTGYVSVKLSPFKHTPDAPLRLKFTFGEIPSEVAASFDPYPGQLSRAWLQDEVITVTQLPATIRIPRRLAFRYAKIELISQSLGYDFKFDTIQVQASTSALNKPAPLSAKTTPLINAIDSIGLKTLKECMQTVYEDGPKRDRRLWIGDLYLESLANAYSFKQHELTKRCLFLLAALADQKNGYLHGSVFESPQPHAQDGNFLWDYALLFNVTLRDYLNATGDRETAAKLWPVVKRQLNIIKSYVDDKGLIDFDRANKEWWLFIDWKEGLHKQTAIQGLSIYALLQTYQLATKLNKEKEVEYLPSLIKKMQVTSRKTFLDKDKSLFFSGPEKQFSYASQIWMILAEVVQPNEAKKILLSIPKEPGILTPGGPYLYHFYIEALIQSNLKEQSRQVMEAYWGKMIEKGADTFWEVFDPTDDYRSPYNFYPINSYCHAWSCTPVYFIRKYPEIFQTP